MCPQLQRQSSAMEPSYGGNRGNMAVTLPAPSRGQRPVEVGKPQQDSNPDKSIL
uniref:hypothetical protein n=1 Tax=Prevotella sp. TaxID=59823 RepID=UPI0040256600